MPQTEDAPPAPTSPHALPAEPAPASPAKPTPAKPPAGRLPPFKVLLHNDDVHDVEYVVATLIKAASLSYFPALKVTMEAHQTGVALVATTHRELAEFYAERIASAGLTATIEPA
ncbi:MAG: ATP-dependent Clp protease adaptor ClpS [Phycisphaerae bacterium]|nr:ATP-dependent Clp protease adaptor ClpS [Phycisphaerae bacterium]